MSGAVQVNRLFVGGECGTGLLGLSRREPMGLLEIRDALVWKDRFRASWQDVARFTGRPIHDVRKACDPSYAEAGGCGVVRGLAVRAGAPS